MTTSRSGQTPVSQALAMAELELESCNPAFWGPQRQALGHSFVEFEIPVSSPTYENEIAMRHYVAGITSVLGDLGVERIDFAWHRSVVQLPRGGEQETLFARAIAWFETDHGALVQTIRKRGPYTAEEIREIARGELREFVTFPSMLRHMAGHPFVELVVPVSSHTFRSAVAADEFKKMIPTILESAGVGVTRIVVQWWGASLEKPANPAETIESREARILVYFGEVVH